MVSLLSASKVSLLKSLDSQVVLLVGEVRSKAPESSDPESRRLQLAAFDLRVFPGERKGRLFGAVPSDVRKVYDLPGATLNDLGLRPR